jgi:hypothetical protein
LGWVLLLDVLAMWPVSVYAWGFGRAALWLVGLVVTVMWLVGPSTARGLRMPSLLIVMLLLFATTRLPTGNVWDALLDPLSWLVMQVLLARCLRCRLRNSHQLSSRAA